MLRILQVVPSLTVGGVERVTIDTAVGLRATFPQIPTYVASAGGKLTPLLMAAGAQHITLPALCSKNPLTLLRGAFRLARIIREHNITIVHARSRAPAWSAWIAARMTQRIFMTTYHGFYGGGSWLKELYNSIMLRGTRILVISQFLCRYLQEAHPLLADKFRFVPEGIDVNFFAPARVKAIEALDLRHSWQIAPEQHLLLLPGRFTKRKGHKIVLQALQQLNDPTLIVVFLGKVDKSKYFQELCDLGHHLGVLSQVRFIEDGVPMNVAYKAADIVLAPAITPETFGRVTAEAGAMERIVIATAIGATPELCYDEKTGFLIPPDDAPALAQAIRLVLDLSFDQRQTIGKAAREHITAHYSCDHMLEQTLHVYHEVCQENEKNPHH